MLPTAWATGFRGRERAGNIKVITSSCLWNEGLSRRKKIRIGLHLERLDLWWKSWVFYKEGQTLFFGSEGE